MATETPHRYRRMDTADWSTPRRPRRTASALWSVSQYRDAVAAAVEESGRPGTLEFVFGPFVRLASHVSAVCLVRNLPLLRALLSRGLSTGVVHGARLEAGIQSLLEKSPHLLAASERASDVAHHATNHCMHVMRMARLLHSEEFAPAWGDARRC